MNAILKLNAKITWPCLNGVILVVYGSSSYREFASVDILSWAELWKNRKIA
jgi:hypothetical protein